VVSALPSPLVECRGCGLAVNANETWSVERTGPLVGRYWSRGYCRGCTIALVQEDPDSWYAAEVARMKERAPA
jgi:hypothetical protein